MMTCGTWNVTAGGEEGYPAARQEQAAVPVPAADGAAVAARGQRAAQVPAPLRLEHHQGVRVLGQDEGGAAPQCRLRHS